jgi:hypothetical protein
MTLTTAVWISLIAAAGTTAVRALRTRPDKDDDAWRPHVTSGCGR